MNNAIPRWIDFGLMPLINVAVAFLIAGLVVLFVGENPLEAAYLIFKGAFGNGYNLGFTLFYATTFIFTGLAVAVAFHASLFNIGGEGQAYIGGLGVGLVCLSMDAYLPWWLTFPLAIIGAALFGALWAFIPAFLQAKRGSHIVITTIMFNFIASAVMVYLLGGPLQKSALIDAGIKLLDGTMFSGHTEFFMQQSDRKKVVMMLANQAMKVALVTTHLPLKDIPAAITADNVRQTVQIVIDDMREKFGLTQPRILVCGLNPHAGEGGHLGSEEIEIINPVLQEFIDAGVNISEAMPADTLFTTRHLTNCDAVVAMYHDQGLIPFKLISGYHGVNYTAGMPIVRTSPDHGVAYDIAGNGNANPSSFREAIYLAMDVFRRRAEVKPLVDTALESTKSPLLKEPELE